MDLEEAYAKLGLEHPVLFSMDKEGKRGSGASTHMLIEMLLDLHEGEQLLSIQERQKLKVICIVRDSQVGRQLRERFGDFNETLGLGVSAERVQFILSTVEEDRLRGYIFYTWGIYCDHWVKEREDHKYKPLCGPYRCVRRLESLDGEQFMAYDRDDNVVCALDRSAAFKLIGDATCPIELRTSPSVSATTVAAWKDPKFAQHTRLRKRFEF